LAEVFPESSRCNSGKRKTAKDAQKPKYAADVPEFLLTPEKVETDLLGTSNFSMVCPVKLRFRKALTFSTYREA
jgi:hypothetical protein